MSDQNLAEFLAWLDIQLKDRGWSDSQLAKKAGIAHSVISKARSNYQRIGWEATLAIAHALDIPATIVLRKAGLLPPAEPDPTSSEKEMLAIFNRLTEKDQKEILQIVRIKLRR